MHGEVLASEVRAHGSKSSNHSYTILLWYGRIFIREGQDPILEFKKFTLSIGLFLKERHSTLVVTFVCIHLIGQPWAWKRQDRR